MATATEKAWVTEADWAMHRETISYFYADEGHTLSEVMAIMEKEYGFHATVKMYKSRFKRWGLWKYTKAEDVTKIILQKPELSAKQPESSYVFVNGRYVELRRVDAYLKRRRLRVNARLQDHLQNQLRQSAGSLLALPGASPYQPSPQAFKGEEHTYRAIQAYFDSRLSASRWSFQSSRGIDMATPEGMAGTRQWSDFFERFRIAIPLVQDGTPERATEGVKMIRTCFAEVATVLRYEDPGVMFSVLSILRLLRPAGDRLASLPQQFLLQFASLAAMMHHPTAPIWNALLQNMDEGILDDYRSLRAMTVIADQMARWLGPQHAKTTEMFVLSTVFNEVDLDKKVANLERVLADLKKQGPFDARHAASCMNLASLFFMNGKLDKASEIILSILCDPEKKRITRGRPTIMYKILRMLGRVCYLQQRFDESKLYLLRATEIARDLTKEWGTAGLLACLVSLENCLRLQGDTAEADAVVRERAALISDKLKSVGERESSVEGVQVV